MRHALRNLIAFVFLGGIFWFVYQDVDNIWQPGFQLTIGGLVLVFAVFWLLVPWLVVKIRIRRRERHNLREYREWVASGGRSVCARRLSARLGPRPGEKEVFHEKGTLYVGDATELAGAAVPCRIGEVAFPGERQRWRKIQRVHFYLTDQRLIFCGKDLDERFGRTDVAGCRATPGGLVFELADGGALAFTFRNPLIALDCLKTVLREAGESPTSVRNFDIIKETEKRGG